MSTLSNPTNSRVFLIEGVNYQMETSNYVFDYNGCPAPRKPYTASLITYNRNLGLNISPVYETPISGNRNTLFNYDIFGAPITTSNNGYFRAKIDVNNPSDGCDYVEKVWDWTVISAGLTGFSSQEWAPKYFYSKHFPVNVNFWWCVISKPPRVLPGQTVTLYKGFPFSYEIPLIDPLSRIPDTITVNGLPPGPVEFAFDRKPNAIKGADGVYYPESYLPVIKGVPSANGVFISSITSTNPIGSTTELITFLVIDAPIRFFALGGVGASEIRLGSSAVDAVHLGNTQIYPYA